MVVDPHCNVINPARALGIKAKEFMSLLDTVEMDLLPTVESAINTRKASGQAEREEGALIEAVLPKVETRLGQQSELLAIRSEIKRQKTKLRQSGILAKLFGISAYRKLRLARMRQRFQQVANPCKHEAAHEELRAS